MTKIYITTKMENTKCPSCKKIISWLTPEMKELTDDDPTFFICFDCEFIGQIGIGEVKP